MLFGELREEFEFGIPLPTSITGHLELAGFLRDLLAIYAQISVGKAPESQEVLPPGWFTYGILPPDGVDDGAMAIECPVPTLLKRPDESRTSRVAVGYSLENLIRGVAQDFIERAWEAEPRPRLWADANNDFSVELDPGSGISVVGYQLSVILSSGRRPPALCHCGELFIPKRKPRSDQRVWCPKCQDLREPQRYAQAQYRARRSKPLR